MERSKKVNLNKDKAVADGCKSLGIEAPLRLLVSDHGPLLISKVFYDKQKTKTST